MESVAFHFSVPQIRRLQVKKRRKTLFVFSKFFIHFFLSHWFCQCFFSVLFLSLDLKGRLHFFYHSAQRCPCTSCPHQYLILLDDVLSCKGFECHRHVPDPGSFWLSPMSNVTTNVPNNIFNGVKNHQLVRARCDGGESWWDDKRHMCAWQRFGYFIYCGGDCVHGFNHAARPQQPLLKPRLNWDFIWTDRF